MYYPEQVMFGVPIEDQSFVWTYFGIITTFGFIENRCMVQGSVSAMCGTMVYPQENMGWWQMILDIWKKQQENSKIELLFGLVTP